MVMQVSHRQLAINTLNRRNRQISVVVLVLVIVLHVSVAYFISLEKTKIPEVVKQQTIEVNIIQPPIPEPVQKPEKIKPPEPPKLTQDVPKKSPQQVEPTPPKALQKPADSKPPVQPRDTETPKAPQKTVETHVEQAVVSETTTSKSSNAAASPNKQTTTASPASPTDSTSDKAASTETRSGCRAPAYPEESELNGDEGTTTLALLIGANGKVLDAKIDQSSGFAELDRAAKKALVLCTFQPATRRGQPEQSWAKLSWKWQLKN